MTSISSVMQSMNLPQNQQVQKSTQTGNGKEFGKIFEKQKNTVTNGENTDFKAASRDEGKKDEVKTASDTENSTQETEKSSKETAPKSNVKETKTKNVSEQKDDITEDEMEVIATAINTIREALMEELGLSEEELNSLLSDMSVNGLDLLNSSVLTDVVLQSQGALDGTELLTDENLFDLHKELQNQLSDVKDGLQEAGIEDYDATVLTGEENIDFSILVNKGQENLNSSQENSLDSENETLNKITGSKNKNDNDGTELNSLTYNTAGQIQEQGVSEIASANQSAPTSYVNQTDNVMNQVLNQIRFVVSNDTTEVNLQLQPETLGTIQIQISAKEGVMTAHFSAENEDVKNILETQMDLLKQSFNEQNIKVDAIEVSVGTQLFDSNLMQNKDEQSKEEESGTKRRRSISLEGFEVDADLDTEEKIIAEMMRANGNTVDYQA